LVAIPGEDYSSIIMGFSSGLVLGALAGYQPVFPKGKVLSCKKNGISLWH
jgi:hypothetical protein